MSPLDPEVDEDNSTTEPEVDEQEQQVTQPDGAPDEDNSEEEELPPELAAVMAKFQGDPKKLAKSYSELEKKLGVLGTKAAMFDEILAAQPQTAPAKKEGPAKPRSVEDIIAYASKVHEEGGDATSALVAAIVDLVDGKLESAIQPLSQKTAALTFDQIEQQFVAQYPDALKYAGLMEQVIKRNPGLLPKDGSTEQIMEGLEMALLKAKKLAGVQETPAAKPTVKPSTPSRKVGTVDTGRSSRQSADAVVSGDRQLFEKWRKSGQEGDLIALVKARMGAAE